MFHNATAASSPSCSSALFNNGLCEVTKFSKMYKANIIGNKASPLYLIVHFSSLRSVFFVQLADFPILEVQLSTNSLTLTLDELT